MHIIVITQLGYFETILKIHPFSAVSCFDLQVVVLISLYVSFDSGKK